MRRCMCDECNAGSEQCNWFSAFDSSDVAVGSTVLMSMLLFSEWLIQMNTDLNEKSENNKTSSCFNHEFYVWTSNNKTAEFPPAKNCVRLARQNDIAIDYTQSKNQHIFTKKNTWIFPPRIGEQLPGNLTSFTTECTNTFCIRIVLEI